MILVDDLGLVVAGHRFHPRTIVLDPYARAISGGQLWPPGAQLVGDTAPLLAGGVSIVLSECRADPG